MIGGALHEGRASLPYWRDLDRSYALQATATVDESNTQGAALAALMGSITRLSRPSLQVQLDDLVSGSAASAVDADAMSTPAPADGVGATVAAALAQRATAMADLRTAVDGVLGMAVLAVPGSATTTSAPATGPTWSAGRATTAMAAVGRLLVAADRSYAAARHRLAGAPGHQRLPRSVWVPAPAAWSGPAVAGLVAAMTSGGSNLAPVRQLCVLVVDLSPAAVPPGTSTTQPPPGRSAGGGCPAPPPAEGVATVPPTSTLGVTVVVGNVGTVAQRTVVGVTLEPGKGGPPSSASRSVTLQPGTSTAVDLPPLRVSTGRAALRVALSAAPSQSDPSGAAAGPYQITVAPPTPPPTTTTTTTTTVPRRSGHSGSSASTGTTRTT